ncbi:MAG: ketopantoate reductase family protein [Sphaerochaetaceae bacterium]
MRIAIYGAGSLGTVLGEYLTESGMAVDLISRNRDHVKARQEKGAQIIGKRSTTIPVTALLPEEMQGIYDLIFLLTKQLKNKQVATVLKPFLAENGMLCTMQNGIPEPLLMNILGSNRICGCTIGWGATLINSGIVELTSEENTFSFNLGLPVPEEEPWLEKISSVLSHMGLVTIEKNFMGARWSKLLINASFSGTATVLGGTFGEVAKNKKARSVAQLIIKECIDVAKASSVTLEPVQGKNIARLFDYQGTLKKWLSFTLIPFAIRRHRQLKPSMLQDIEKGKPCEVDAINGVVSEQGRKMGIPTPVNDQVVSLIHQIERHERKPSKENLREFEL